MKASTFIGFLIGIPIFFGSVIACIATAFAFVAYLFGGVRHGSAFLNIIHDPYLAVLSFVICPAIIFVGLMQLRSAMPQKQKARSRIAPGGLTNVK